jgi:hypothetical protein
MTDRYSHGSPRSLLRPPLSTLLLAFFAAVAPGIASAQEGDPPQEGPQLLNVFLDCHLVISCDTDHFRREITFVNWVRNREDAHLHLILTYATAASGTEYQFDLIGLTGFEGQDERLTWTSSSVNTRDEIINGITRTMALGFVGYAQQLGLAEQLRVEFDAPDDVQQVRQAQNAQDPEDDPWDFWVFRLNGRVDLSGQDRRKTRNLNGTVTANRVTDDLKLQFNVTGRSNHTENQLSSGTWFDSDTKSWSATGVAVKSLTDHWSFGAQFGSGSSSSANRRIGYRAAPALEWNLFPYSESTRRQLIFMYQVGAAWIDWWEETIFEKTEEWVYDHRLRGDLNFRQPWGSGGTAVQIGSLLDDFSKWALSVQGTVNFRVFRGLSLTVGGNYNIIRDQLGIRRRNLTDEEILTARKQLATESSYRMNLGFTYDFGSVFNNIVNTRFPTDVRGALF